MNSSPTTTDVFLDSVRKCSFIKPEAIDSLLEQLSKSGEMSDDPMDLARKFVAKGLLTRFQAEQLLQGRWKNFQLAGKYNILERLSTGPMSTVFLCEHETMRRLVALKLLPAEKAKDPTTLSRFHREARAAARLRHPNVVAVYDLDRAGGLHFLVAEYVDGLDLERIVSATGPMTIDRAADCIRQAAEGLQHAHEMGMVHRDIKPGNLLLDRSGTVKLLDLGLARLFLDESDGMTKVDDGKMLLGTVDYLAPEQAIDSHDVDIRADIYSLGATAFFLLSGQTLFSGASTVQKLAMHGHRPPEQIVRELTGIPRGFADILVKMLAKEPADRYQTPAEVAEAMAPWSSQNLIPPSSEEMPRHCLATRRAVEKSRSSAVRPAAKSVSIVARLPAIQSKASSSNMLLRKKWAAAKRVPTTPKLWIGGGAVAATLVIALGVLVWWAGGPSKTDFVTTPNQNVASAGNRPVENRVGPINQAIAADVPQKHGTFKPIDLAPAATVITTQGMFFSPDSTLERLVFPDWSPKTFEGVPFNLVDPQGTSIPNAIMLYGPNGENAPKMPHSVSLECNAPAKVIHFLSGISGWGANDRGHVNLEKTVSMIVRLHYANGEIEDHSLRNAVHFADYIRIFEVPGSKLAFQLGDEYEKKQIRYLTINPRKSNTIETIELVKGPDQTAPIVMAVTIEGID